MASVSANCQPFVILLLSLILTPGYALVSHPLAAPPRASFAAARAAPRLCSGDERNGLDADYPWRFEGRLWFRPALVRARPESLPEGVSPVALFGWTVGGVVALGAWPRSTAQTNRPPFRIGRRCCMRFACLHADPAMAVSPRAICPVSPDAAPPACQLHRRAPAACDAASRSRIARSAMPLAACV
mmetsp:Transcript_66963/g.183675  ORF Transcript_66963/g.183675 Transcript_66963/m.183675 type:complete len:186 (-) Transcript_66963:676-1233(-)